MADRPVETMTPREASVLALLAEGLQRKEIAARLQLTPRTVNAHETNIYSKLGVGTRLEAAVHVWRGRVQELEQQLAESS